jgi:hypothetical protein
MQMDREDYEPLKRIKAGERAFAQKDGQPYEDFEREVLRLLRLRDRRLITMKPEPMRSSMTARGEYLKTGICELTLEGHEVLDRYQP